MANRQQEKLKRKEIEVRVNIFDHPRFCNTGHLDGRDGFDECPFLVDNESGCYLFGEPELEYRDESSYDGIYLKKESCRKAYEGQKNYSCPDY